MNFNLKKLFHRKEMLNDAETAYVEGRATKAEVQQMRDRIASLPDREAELESLRSTVQLLRSIEPASAPRSFALSEAPVPVRSASRRMAFAPAMAAIVAAVGVGVLTAGDLTGYVSQTDSGGADDRLRSTMTVESDDQPAGPDGPPGPSGTPNAFLGSRAEQDSGSLQPFGGTEATPSAAPGQDTEGAQPAAGATATAVPESLAPSDAGYGMPEAEWNAAQATATAGAREDGTAFTGSLPEDGAPDEGQTRNSGETTNAAIDNAAAAPGDDSLVALPLWQLQVSLAGLTALLIAAWAYLRHRATA